MYTDQRSLRYLLEQRITTQNQQNWLAKLMGYDFDIVYKAGKTNKAADALSRVMEDTASEKAKSLIISRPYWPGAEQIQEEVLKDGDLQKIIKELQKDSGSNGKHTLENDKLHYKGRLVLCPTSVWIPQLLKEFHATPTGGHPGIFRTYRRISQSLHWKGMKKCVTEYVSACPVCQQNKYLASSPQGLLQPLPIPEVVWKEVSMDFIVKLPKSNRFDAIIVVVDRLSKYGHFVPLKHPYSAQIVVEIFMKEVVRLHRISAAIVNDKDPMFMSIF